MKSGITLLLSSFFMLILHSLGVQASRLPGILGRGSELTLELLFGQPPWFFILFMLTIVGSGIYIIIYMGLSRIPHLSENPMLRKLCAVLAIVTTLSLFGFSAVTGGGINAVMENITNMLQTLNVFVVWVGSILVGLLSYFGIKKLTEAQRNANEDFAPTKERTAWVSAVIAFFVSLAAGYGIRGDSDMMSAMLFLATIMLIYLLTSTKENKNIYRKIRGDIEKAKKEKDENKRKEMFDKALRDVSQNLERHKVLANNLISELNNILSGFGRANNYRPSRHQINGAMQTLNDLKTLTGYITDTFFTLTANGNANTNVTGNVNTSQMTDQQFQQSIAMYNAFANRLIALRQTRQLFFEKLQRRDPNPLQEVQ